MNEGLTLDGLAVALRALRLLAVDFGHLSAPCVDVSTHFPNRLALSFHDDLAGFEAWRDALSIVPDAVTHSTQNDGRTRVLKATADFAGAALKLTGFAEIIPTPVGSAA
ncbi:hypothetical protein ACIO93_24550 [Streptomyces sp. NPDC087903]|uniref:hypothetical protein n=1 Tax=Streptomyces sp. NPDC087903 TaxID=3365819 RepID=UPI0038282D71